MPNDPAPPRCQIDFTLEHEGVPRPDGPVSLEIDGRELLQRAGVEGVLDVDSLRVTDLNWYGAGDQAERFGGDARIDCPVQFVPAPGFDPLLNPRGRLLFALHKLTWEDKRFPRRYRLDFGVTRPGGARRWTPDAESPVVPMRMTRREREVDIVRADGEPTLRFSLPYGRKPGLHPVATPAGAVLTEDRPRDHTWHRGVWFGWTQLRGDDTLARPYTFWCEPNLGVIHDLGTTDEAHGPLCWAFTSHSLWCNELGRPIMRCRLRVELQPVGRHWNWVDLTLTLAAAHDQPVRLETGYGHLSARASYHLDEPLALDSACSPQGPALSGTARENVPIAWTGFGGKLAGRDACLLLLDHPSNPQPAWRDTFFERRSLPMDRGDLFLCVALNALRDRPMQIEPGEELTWRYRVVTADRPLDHDFATYQHAHWATPLRVVGL